MHEYSLVRSLLRQVAELMTEHGGTAVESIRVQMGPLSGVERELVEIAFAEEAENSACRVARLIVEEIPLSATCRDCGADFTVERFQFRCTACDSPRMRILSGDEFKLMDIELQHATTKTETSNKSEASRHGRPNS